MAKHASNPRRRRTSVMSFSLSPTMFRTACGRIARPAKYVARAAPRMPMMLKTKPRTGPNAITAKSVIKGRGNMTKQAGV
jgi:hypothetical protein